MRYVFAIALLFVAPLLAFTDPPERREKAAITLLMEFESGRSEASIDAMKREFEAILKQAGLTFDYKLRSELNESDSPVDIIHVKFKGECRMQTMPVVFDERGPFAITHTVDNQVLPFSEVGCDRIRVSVRSAMFGGDFEKSDLLLGRALGRVLAHEVYHILANTTGHGKAGVARTALSGRQLIAEHLAFDKHDIDKLRK